MAVKVEWDMSKDRRKHSPSFKAKVALEWNSTRNTDWRYWWLSVLLVKSLEIAGPLTNFH